jgi:pentatricopeptide repeat protein
MQFIYVKLLGDPDVIFGEKKILFPFKKVEALFYYLVIKKQASRDELVNLLWGEVDEAVAKKNLRNAIYRIKKVFDMDIIISPKKSVITINPEVKVETDLDQFENSEDKWIEAYKGEFLEGFGVKDSENFEGWISDKREEYKEKYISKLHGKIREQLRSNDYDNVEYLSKLLISADEFNERAYRTLMKLYVKKGSMNKAIDIFNKLSEKLKAELGILPEPKTMELYNRILAIRNSEEASTKSKQEDFFYGRYEEIDVANRRYKDFINNNPFKSVVILGEAGIGKTRFKDRLVEKLADEDIYLFETNCYQAEKDYILKPWNTIFSRVAEIVKDDKINISMFSGNIMSYLFPALYSEGLVQSSEKSIDVIKHQAAEEAILEILKKISMLRKVVIVIEDLQWMDSMSLSLLNTILLHNKDSRIFFIITCRDTHEKDIDRFVTITAKYDKVQKIILKRFNNDEVTDFVKRALPEHDISCAMSQRIYEETEGNTFFIVEYLNSIKENRDINIMSLKVQDVLRSRFLEVSDDGKKILDIISVFFDEASLDVLKEISGRDELDIIDLLEELENKSIIDDTSDDDKISFRFTHQKLRDYVYSQQSSAKRKVLHNRVGSILEKELKNNNSDIFLFSKLIYHFLRGGNKLAALKYSIKNLNFYFDFSHELFSAAYELNIQEKKSIYISKEKTIKQLDNIRDLINEVKKSEAEANEIENLEIDFLHMKGRFFIREGNYDEGTLCIERLINLSIKVKNNNYLLKGYRQMIYYCIQVYNTDLMKEYLDRAIIMSKENDDYFETATLLRLKGLNKIMLGQKEEAEQLLKESIDIFSSIDKLHEKYYLSIAGAYNYIGEIRRQDMRYSSALEYYDKAIEICEGKSTLTGLTIFYSNAGQAAFELGDYDISRQYFSKAIKIFNEIDSIWGRSIAEGYLALLKVKQSNLAEALDHLKMADFYSEKIQNPRELGIVYRIKAEIRSYMEKSPTIFRVFGEYLNLDIKSYCDKGMQLLEGIGQGNEVNILKIFAKASQ